MNSSMTPLRKMATARYVVTKRMPYFATGMRSLVPIECEQIGTLAVTEDARMFWAPTFVSLLSVPELAFVLAHELLHVLRNHVKQMRMAGITAGSKWARVANLAMDCEINDDLVAAGFAMPAGELRGVLAADFGLPDGRPWVEYFRAMRDQINDGTAAPKLEAAVSGERGEPKPGAGDCGGATGDPHPLEGAAGEATGAGETDGRTPRDLSRIRRDAAKQVQQAAAKGRGSVPGGFRRWADDCVKPAMVPWRVKLARDLRRARSFVGNGTHPTYNRVGPLQPVYGFGVGRPVLPVYRAPVPNVWVVLDTSGSMGSAEINDSIAEIVGIVRSLQGAKITFLSGDCTVTDKVQARSFADIREHIAGGGGTDFRPPFELACKQSRNARPDVLVYCTDGMGPAPSSPPPGIKTIWCLVGRYRKAPAPWGDVVDLGAA